MTTRIVVSSLPDELNSLNERISALRTARLSSRLDIAEALDAALLELDVAAEELHAAWEALDAATREGGDSSHGAEAAEKTLLRLLFRELPVPVVVLNGSGMVRRLNLAAARFLGVPLGAIAGKPFTSLVDLPHRAVLRSCLAATSRTDQASTCTIRLTGPAGNTDVQVTLTPLRGASRPRSLVVAVLSADEDPQMLTRVNGADAAEPGAHPTEPTADRIDLMARVTELLLTSTTVAPADVLGKAADILAAGLGDWAVIDLLGGDGPERVAVAAPPAGENGLAALAGQRPDACPVVVTTLGGGGATLHELLDGAQVLGHTSDGRSLLDVLNAGSLIAVPLQHEAGTDGALTLVRPAERRPHDFWDLRVAQEIGRHLALALRNR